MSTFLRRYPVSLLLVCIFVAIRTGYGQATDYVSLTNAGRVEYWAGHFEAAETLLRSALELAQNSGDDVTIAAVQADLGAVYEDEERLIEAERAYSKALFIFRRIPDKNYETAVILRNLASVYSLTRRYSDALKVLVEAPKLLKKNTPDEQTLTAQLLNSRGMVYFRQGKLRPAEALLAEALEMRSLAGVDSDNIEAQILSNLGSVYQKQHKYGKAEESYTRSLAITEQRLGPMHPYLTLTLGNLGGLYTEMRRYSETGDQYRRSLAILEQMTPAPDARIVRTLHWLAKNYIQLGDKTSAESALARAVEIARRNRVPNPEMPMLLDAYGDILKSLGKVQEAQRLHTEARRTRAALALMIRVPNPK